MDWQHTGRKLSVKAIRLLTRSRLKENEISLLLALLIGLITGFVAVGFHHLVNFTQIIFNSYARKGLAYIHVYFFFFLPAIGGLCSGLVIRYLAAEARGHGVSEVIEAVSIQGGRIPLRVGLAKALASAFTLGSGGSGGLEGPIVQIGSSVGSSIGQVFKMSETRLKHLLGCGAAAGISALFNAPIAGVLFSLEVILGDFSTRAFSSLVLSSVIASVVSRAFFGNQPLLKMPYYGLISVPELIFYVGLGLLMAMVAYAFCRIMDRLESYFSALKSMPVVLRPALGGLMVGGMGILFPLALGGSFLAISQALYGELSIKLLFWLLIAKMVMTALTLGSGGSGGVFSPLLFCGAMGGAAFGRGVGILFPAFTAASGAYALVGMAACFAAAAQAPITAIILVFELTNDYHIVLPLMFACVISTQLFNRWSPESIYTLRLRKRGIHVVQGRDQDIMRNLTVEMAMQRNVDVVHVDDEIGVFMDCVQRTGHHTLPVLDEKNHMAGMLSIHDVNLFRDPASGQYYKVKDVMTGENLQTVFPDEWFATALQRMGRRDVGRLPVMSRRNPKRLIGIISRGDIIKRYNHELVKRHMAQE